MTARLTPGTAWQLLPVPGRWGPDERLANALWLAVTLAPFGYWLGRAAALPGAWGRAVASALVVVAAGLWAVPAALGHDAAPWGEWAGSAAGVVGGIAAGRRRRATDGRRAERSPERRVAARTGARQLSRP